MGLILFTANFALSQVCIPTYGTVCFSAFTDDVIDNFWTEGGITDISNMDTDCCLLPDNYWYTGMAVTACPGETITTNVQCQLDAYDQGFAIWIDWNSDDVFSVAEKVYESPGFGDEVWTGSFTVPLDATPGATYNMRVRAEYAVGGASIDPCDFQTYGETEDYLVIIGTCDPTMCEGDSVLLDLGTMPPGPITYSWSPTTDIDDPTGGPTVTVWPADSTIYTCTITSPDSTWTVEKHVAVIHPANPDAGLDGAICHDVLVGYPLDGTIDVAEDQVTMNWDVNEFFGVGTPATIYAPDDDVIDPTLQVSLPGTYEIIFSTTDNFGFCPDQSDTVLVTFSEPLHELDSINPACFGYADGSIIVTGTGTLPSVEYQLDGGAWQPSNLFTGLASGTYSVTSRDSIGCEYTSEIELIDPDPVVLTVSSDTLICQNGTATVTASATGGTSFTYGWDIPGADSTAVQSISPTDPTTITVVAFNEAGCFSDPATIEVTLRDPITLSITPIDSICPGFESGATVTASGGDGAFTYSWTANASPMPDLGNSITTSPSVNTIYCVTVADGCETTPEVICTETHMNPVPIPTFVSDTTIACVPDTIHFTAIGEPGDEYIWTMDGRTYSGTGTVSHEFASVGVYDVTLEVTNAYGCYASFTANEYIEIIDVPHPRMFINPNPTTIFNTKVVMTNSEDEDENTFEWTFESGVPSTSNEASPTVIFPEGIANSYLVELTVTNEYNCSTTITDYANIVSDVIIYAPNIFTPDGDEFNEGWRVYIDGIDFYDYNCQIYNRWGEIVWESFDASATWYGTYGGGAAPEGTYVWVITAKDGTTDKQYKFNGTVAIYR